MSVVNKTSITFTVHREIFATVGEFDASWYFSLNTTWNQDGTKTVIKCRKDKIKQNENNTVYGSYGNILIKWKLFKFSQLNTK